MARIFTIEFPYDNALQHAIIVVRETAFYKEYKVSLQSPELNTLLLSDKIISMEKGSFVFSNVPAHEYNDVMKQILKAVAGHIHSLQH